MWLVWHGARPVNLVSIRGTRDRIRWNFPPTGGGVSQGFNDSGQEFFKGNIMEHVVREIIQNSLDANNAPNPPVGQLPEPGPQQAFLGRCPLSCINGIPGL